MNAQNQILTSLSADVRDRLAPHCNSVALAQGEFMYQPGETLTQLYFPVNCLFSVTITMQDGSTAEVGMVGRREVLGIHTFLSNRETIQTECVVQVAGEAVKIDAKVVRQEFDRNGELRDVLLRYAQAFVAQVSQTAACINLATFVLAYRASTSLSTPMLVG
jgi:CRP-like cAMP-binding protein